MRFHCNSKCYNYRKFKLDYELKRPEGTSPAVKEVCRAEEGHCEKKMWNLRWWSRNGCGGRLMTKILTTTIQVNLCCLLHVSLGFGSKFIWIAIIESFSISLPSQPFLGRHLGFHVFFTMESHPLFLQMGCFGLDFTSFYNCMLCIASILLSLIEYLLLSTLLLTTYGYIMYLMHFELKFIHKFNVNAWYLMDLLVELWTVWSCLFGWLLTQPIYWMISWIVYTLWSLTQLNSLLNYF